MPSQPSELDLSDLAETSWRTHLKAERKSVATVRLYLTGVRTFLAWCAKTGTPAVLTRAAVSGFVADMLQAGSEPATARARQLALRRFSAWLTEEGELDADPLLGMKPPKLDT